MLLPGHGVHFILEHAQSFDHFGASFVRLDDIIHETSLGSDERVGKPFAELFCLLLARGGLILDSGNLAPIYDINRAFRTHYSNFSHGPGEIDICAKML